MNRSEGGHKPSVSPPLLSFAIFRDVRPDATYIHVCFFPSHTCICVVPKNIRPGQVRDEYVMTKARERKVEGTRSRNHSQQSKHNLTYCLCALKSLDLLKPFAYTRRSCCLSSIRVNRKEIGGREEVLRSNLGF